MTESEILRLYRTWADSDSAVLPNPIPLGNIDVFEDKNKVLNRLFWAIPLLDGGALRLFLYFEEVTFSKDLSGDLILISSKFYPVRI